MCSGYRADTVGDAWLHLHYSPGSSKGEARLRDQRLIFAGGGGSGAGARYSEGSVPAATVNVRLQVKILSTH